MTSQHCDSWAPRPTRPRSWCSWAMPKRSASRITITVAFGTSTPTSMTVVATSTSSVAGAEGGHRRLLLGRRHPPVQQPEAQPGELAGRAAARTSPRPRPPRASRSPRSAGTRRRPGGPPPPRRAPPPTPPPRQSPAAQRVTIGVRPGGSSSRTLTSRSPYTVIAAVRGIGVAVITSTSGTAAPAFSRSAARCSTPKRCCSSTTTTPRLWNATPSWISAWVPMARSTRAVGEPGEDALALGARDPVGQQLDAQRPVGEQAVALRRDLEVGEQRLDRRWRAARRGPRSAPSARPGARPRRPPAARRRRRPSCRRRRRPAAGGASGAARRGRRRSRRSPGAGPRSAGTCRAARKRAHELAVRRRGGSRRRRAPSPACA